MTELTKEFDVSNTSDRLRVSEYVPSTLRDASESRADWDPMCSGEPPISRFVAAGVLTSVIGEMLYAVRLPDGIVKIGHTKRLAYRLAQYSNCRVLGIKPGTRADEAALHALLAPHVSRGREWYNPTPEVLAVVNQWRAELGREPITA